MCCEQEGESVEMIPTQREKALNLRALSIYVKIRAITPLRQVCLVSYRENKREVKFSV